MSLWRRCIEPDCRIRTLGTRCDDHEIARRQARERDRPSREERGYGADHQRARAVLKSTLPGLCAYGCGTWLEPGDDWVAAHVRDGDPGSPRVAACRSCNERAKRR